MFIVFEAGRRDEQPVITSVEVAHGHIVEELRGIHADGLARGDERNIGILTGGFFVVVAGADLREVLHALAALSRDEAEHQAFVAEKMAGYRAGGLSGNYAPQTPDFAFEDICAAVKLVRERAAEFNVQPDKIGIVGFSAGALLAVYNAECAPDESRADFIGSIYGQLVMREMPEKLPPLFAAMSSDDELSGQSGFEVFQAWQKRGIAELHLFGQGGHNFGMGHEPYTSALWPEEFLAWLKMIKVIK